MGHTPQKNNNEDDIVSDSDVEEQDNQDQHDYENYGARPNFPMNNEHDWRPWSQEPLVFVLPQEVTHLQLQLLFPFPCRSMSRPPPIAVHIPITHWHQIIRPQGIPIMNTGNRMRYSGPHPPVFDCRVQNHQFSERQISHVEHSPRSPSTTPPQAAYHENSVIADGRYHPYQKPQTSAEEGELGPTSRLMRRKSRRPRNRRCRMNRVDLGVITIENPQQAENNEEEEEEEDDAVDVQPCEAYKDLHYDNDNDDDDNNRSHNVIPNV